MLQSRSIALALFSLLLAGLLTPRHAKAQTLRGSKAAVTRVHNHALEHGLYFYRTSEGIQRAGREGRLVRLSGNADYRLHNVSHPYATRATVTFVERLASQYRAACGERLVVTSAARPQSMRLLNGSERSVHPTGMAVDLRKPQNPRCLAWLRSTLLQLERAGVIDATEEFRPPHFHVAVFPQPYTRYVQRRGGAAPAYASSFAAPARYRVRAGDSLWRIAREHDTTVAALKAANGLRGTTLRVGQQLVIP
jgi:hypothetical protein